MKEKKMNMNLKVRILKACVYGLPRDRTMVLQINGMKCVSWEEKINVEVHITKSWLTKTNLTEKQQTEK